jgi:endoglucanase
MTPLFVNDFDRVKNFRDQYPLVDKIFQQPVSFWLGTRKNKSADNVYKRVSRLMKRSAGYEPVIVIYNLPDRDLGKWSRGGAEGGQEYINFVRAIASAIGNRQPVVIYEPDALPHSTLMNSRDQDNRLMLMRYALRALCRDCSAHVYVDIGHSNWLSPDDAAALLQQVHEPGIRGFSVNVSNYRSTAECTSWALRVAESAPAPHFVIDTSRNGNGPYGNDWCNPPGRALGTPPTFDTDHELCDAYLWIKIPGESDGKCNGGPRAGKFWPEYAEELVRNAS